MTKLLALSYAGKSIELAVRLNLLMQVLGADYRIAGLPAEMHRTDQRVRRP